MDWERNLASLVKDTESNLERAQWKLSSANSTAYSQNNGDSGMFMQSTYGNHCSILPYPPPSNFSKTYATYAYPPMHSLAYHPQQHPSTMDQTTPIQDRRGPILNSDVGGRLQLDSSTSLITTLNDRINDQNSIIEKLTQHLSQVDKERDLFSKQLQLLKDEMAQLRSRLCGEDGMTVASERRIEGTLEGWRKHIMSDIGLLRQELELLKSSRNYETRLIMDRGEQFNKLNSVVSDLQRHTQTDCRSLKMEHQDFDERLARVEADALDLKLLGSQYKNTLVPSMVQDSNHRPDPEDLWNGPRIPRVTKNVSFKPQSSLTKQDVTPTSGDKKTTSWIPYNDQQPHINRLKGEYKVLQQKLKDLDKNFLRDSDDDERKPERPRSSRGRRGAGAKSGGDSSVISLSPAGSDIDISMLTTEPLTLSAFEDDDTMSPRRHDTQLSDYIFTDDLTTDVTDDCLSIDDL